jgi:hypothetical protein
MFKGMDIPWVSALNPIKHPKPEPQQADDDITKFGPAALELVKRIIARALEPFPEAARAVGAHLRANHRALFNLGLPQRPIDYDALIVNPALDLEPQPA